MQTSYSKPGVIGVASVQSFHIVQSTERRCPRNVLQFVFEVLHEIQRNAIAESLCARQFKGIVDQLRTTCQMDLAVVLDQCVRQQFVVIQIVLDAIVTGLTFVQQQPVGVVQRNVSDRRRSAAEPLGGACLVKVSPRTTSHINGNPPDWVRLSTIVARQIAILTQGDFVGGVVSLNRY